MTVSREGRLLPQLTLISRVPNVQGIIHTWIRSFLSFDSHVRNILCIYCLTCLLYIGLQDDVLRFIEISFAYIDCWETFLTKTVMMISLGVIFVHGTHQDLLLIDSEIQIFLFESSLHVLSRLHSTMPLPESHYLVTHILITLINQVLNILLIELCFFHFVFAVITCHCLCVTLWNICWLWNIDLFMTILLALNFEFGGRCRQGLWRHHRWLTCIFFIIFVGIFRLNLYWGSFGS